VKQYAEETFGYGARVSTTKSPKNREYMDSKNDNKSIALGTSTLSLQRPKVKLSTA
jgi:hypothetical protein